MGFCGLEATMEIYAGLMGILLSNIAPIKTNQELLKALIVLAWLKIVFIYLGWNK
jgi:hypothetical protein